MALKCRYGLKSATLLSIQKCTLVLQLLTLPTKIHCALAGTANSKEQGPVTPNSFLHQNCQHSTDGWVPATRLRVPY